MRRASSVRVNSAASCSLSNDRRDSMAARHCASMSAGHSDWKRHITSPITRAASVPAGGMAEVGARPCSRRAGGMSALEASAGVRGGAAGATAGAASSTREQRRRLRRQVDQDVVMRRVVQRLGCIGQQDGRLRGERMPQAAVRQEIELAECPQLRVERLQRSLISDHNHLLARAVGLAHEPARRVSSGTGRPVAPLAAPLFHAVPAMSRWAQSYFSVKRARKQAAVTLPAGRPPMLPISAKFDLSCSWYSSSSGMRQAVSSDCLPAATSASASASLRAYMPVLMWPSAMMQAPVSVATSITTAGLKRST
ncbi:hypothetical protein COLO4_01367 [Corchorus olitorius]|uniref:Uncharacterized protein n=1 Tax=Corchorus olitorius TaxID=93759 RepID=A0A1R3L2L6_9ROSI|nr:hypothetical protein COLO4_01367 [Corchorus olitorius]